MERRTEDADSEETDDSDDEDNPSYRKRGLNDEYRFNHKAAVTRKNYLIHKAVERKGVKYQRLLIKLMNKLEKIGGNEKLLCQYRAKQIKIIKNVNESLNIDFAPDDKIYKKNSECGVVISVREDGLVKELFKNPGNDALTVGEESQLAQKENGKNYQELRILYQVSVNQEGPGPSTSAPLQFDPLLTSASQSSCHGSHPSYKPGPSTSDDLTWDTLLTSASQSSCPGYDPGPSTSDAFLWGTPPLTSASQSSSHLSYEPGQCDTPLQSGSQSSCNDLHLSNDQLHPSYDQLLPSISSSLGSISPTTCSLSSLSPPTWSLGSICPSLKWKSSCDDPNDPSGYYDKKFIRGEGEEKE